MVIRLALIEPEPVIFESSDRHSGPVCSLDPHSGIFHDKALILTDSQSIRCIVVDLRIRFALFELFSADDQVKFRRMPTSSTILEISFGPVEDTSATV